MKCGDTWYGCEYRVVDFSCKDVTACYSDRRFIYYESSFKIDRFCFDVQGFLMHIFFSSGNLILVLGTRQFVCDTSLPRNSTILSWKM